MAEVEQNFCELAIKLFENYGYNYSNNIAGGGGLKSVSTSGGSYSSNNTSSSGSDMQETARELINDFESPQMRLGWDSLIRAGELCDSREDSKVEHFWMRLLCVHPLSAVHFVLLCIIVL